MFTIRIISIVSIVFVFLLHSALADSVIELVTQEHTFQGRNLAHNSQWCWLASTDGVLMKVNLREVSSFRKLNRDFTPKLPAAIASELRGEVASGMEVQTRGNFVVIAPTGNAHVCADAAEQVHRSFSNYFSRRNWALDQLEFPLVIMVHPSRLEFDKECEAIQIPTSSELKGFYHPQTNRVTLYVEVGSENKAKETSNKGLPDSVRKTLIHETIHQLAFNTGLHSRIAANPRWVVEGLAVDMEAGLLNSSGSQDINSRVNKDRLDWFRQYRATRRSGTIADLISNDEGIYQKSPLDFYSEAWALTFYLSEARRPDYLRYLQRLKEKQTMHAVDSPEERLADFQTVFGNDLAWMEIQFLRFIDGLESR